MKSFAQQGNAADLIAAADFGVGHNINGKRINGFEIDNNYRILILVWIL